MLAEVGYTLAVLWTFVPGQPVQVYNTSMHFDTLRQCQQEVARDRAQLLIEMQQDMRLAGTGEVQCVPAIDFDRSEVK